jgi:hypothetical protein
MSRWSVSRDHIKLSGFEGTIPVIHLASSPAKNLTAAPTSQPVPSVFNRLRFFRAALASSVMPPEYIIGV